MTTHVAPAFRLEMFSCMHCPAIAQHDWEALSDSWNTTRSFLARCAVCRGHSYWNRVGDSGNDQQDYRLTWPPNRPGVMPHTDMPEAARALYDEAREVAACSPRAAVGLLRVAVDVLLREVLEDAGAKPLNEVIGLAIRKGLPEQVGQALDVLRVSGNGALHPATINLDEDEPEAKIAALCELMNLAVEHLVTTPQQVGGLYARLPAGVRAAIQKRDA